jgi:hypothetical protein
LTNQACDQPEWWCSWPATLPILAFASLGVEMLLQVLLPRPDQGLERQLMYGGVCKNVQAPAMDVSAITKNHG